MIQKLDCGEHILEIGKRTLIMGILNVTPDSFSDGGTYVSVEAAVQRAQRMSEEGADILDIGGESTRPGAAKVSLEEELNRVIPVIEAIRSARVNVPISIDTYKAEVAKRAILAGANIINDVWGGKADPAMGRVAAEHGCPYILMHNRTNRDYQHFLQDVLSDLQESIDLARQLGVQKEQIVLDPGIGFAKTQEQNLWLMNHLDKLVELGYPVMLGTSRKSMIYKLLQLPPEDVLEGTAATIALGIVRGCHIMRVHDVQAMKRVAIMTDAMVRNRAVDLTFTH